MLGFFLHIYIYKWSLTAIGHLLVSVLVLNQILGWRQAYLHSTTTTHQI